MINRVQLMEGGDWTQHDLPVTLNIQTAQTKKDDLLKKKIRCYATLFDEVVFSAGDYVQSDSLHMAADADRPLWGPKGPVRLVLSEAIGDVATYRRKKFGGPDHGIWLGKPGDPNEIIKNAKIAEKCELVADVLKTRLLLFNEGDLTERLRQAVVQSAEEFGLKGLAAEMVRDERAKLFNRDTIITLMRRVGAGVEPKLQNDFLRYVNICYYFNGASTLGAELGVHSSEQHMHEVFARVAEAGPKVDLAECQRVSARWADHYAAVNLLVTTAFDPLHLDVEKMLSLPTGAFHELISDPNAFAFRQKLREALPSQGLEQAHALREIPLHLDFVEPFAETVRAMIEREKKWLRPTRTADGVSHVVVQGLAALPAVTGLIGAYVANPSWLKAVSATVGVVAAGVGGKYIVEPLRLLAVRAMRNRTCPLLTFAESANKAIQRHLHG